MKLNESPPNTPSFQVVDKMDTDAVSIPDMFRGHTVLVTGATGFLGKAIIEKMLRDIPEVDTIYILLRSKHPLEEASQRREKLLENSVFDKLKKENLKVFQKLVPISGDIAQEGLGLSPENRAILVNRVHFVFHSAATVKFDENLKIAINVNVRGTQRVLALCKEMRHLKALVHISTAYANCDVTNDLVLETVYPPPPGAMALLDSVDTLSEEFVAENTRKLIGNKPNTYCFTKSMAEWVVKQEAATSGLPVCIVRPSIVSPALKEPLPGWIDNLNGTVGLSLAIGKGFLSMFFGDPDILFDVVPIDLVTNMIICAGWETARKPDILKVYNCCSGPENPLYLRECMGFLNHNWQTACPSASALWYPHVRITSSRAWYWINISLLHYIPYFFLEHFVNPLKTGMTFLSGSGKGETKPKINFLTLLQRTTKAAMAVANFTTKEWRFETRNVKNLHLQAAQSLCSTDGSREKWVFDFGAFTWTEYMRVSSLGIRKFLMKENEVTVTKARKRVNRLYWTRHAVRSAFMAIVAAGIISAMQKPRLMLM